MACQAIVTQYILPLNQKCVCLEASHWQMPNLEAFPPLPCLTPCSPKPFFILCIQILHQGMRNWAFLPLGPCQPQGRNLTFIRHQLCARSCSGSISAFPPQSCLWRPHLERRKLRTEMGYDLPKFWVSLCMVSSYTLCVKQSSCFSPRGQRERHHHQSQLRLPPRRFSCRVSALIHERMAQRATC